VTVVESAIIIECYVEANSCPVTSNKFVTIGGSVMIAGSCILPNPDSGRP